MTVEILPPLPGAGKAEKAPNGFSGGTAAGGQAGMFAAKTFAVRVPPLLVWLLLIPFFLIALPLLLVASLIFGFRVWRRMAAMSRVMAASRGTRPDGNDQNSRARIFHE